MTLRQVHVPGEKLFIDYSGNKLGIVDPNTGEICEAELFVATLGASNYTYAEVTWTQQLPDWIGSHVRALTFFGGCVEMPTARWRRITPWPSSRHGTPDLRDRSGMPGRSG